MITIQKKSVFICGDLWFSSSWIEREEVSTIDKEGVQNHEIR